MKEDLDLVVNDRPNLMADFSDDSCEDLTEEEVLSLLEAQENSIEEDPCPVTVNLLRKGTLFTTVQVDLLNGTVVEGEAVAL